MMRRIRWIYALILALTLALYGCGETNEIIDAGNGGDAARDDDGMPGDKDDDDDEDDEDDEDKDIDKDPGEKDDDEDDEGDRCAEVDCGDDGNACTLNRCNPASGECETIPLNDVSCDDGIYCNGNDICVDGVCTHSGDPCGAGDACVEEFATCGCGGDEDCPAAAWGAWSECDCADPTNSCANTGTRERSRVTSRCEEALCVDDVVETEDEACSCDTNGDECLSPDVEIAGSCDWGACQDGACQIHSCGASEVCDNDRKLCVDCLSDGDCGGATPACDTTSNQCVGCIDDSYCGGAAPACDTTRNQCVPCMSDDHCGGSTPYCDGDTNQCVSCTSRPHCCADYSGSGPCNMQCCGAGTAREFTCSFVGLCDACSTDADCTGDKKFCSANRCVECRASIDCGSHLYECQDNTCVLR